LPLEQNQNLPALIVIQEMVGPQRRHSGTHARIRGRAVITPSAVDLYDGKATADPKRSRRAQTKK